MSDRTAVISVDKVDSSAVPTLVPQGPFLGKPDIPLNRSVITVGSGDKSRLHLVSSTISSAHALLVKSAGQTYIADLASRTGIQINGKPISFSYLKPGDRLQIGRFVFRFRSPQTSTNFPPNPPPASVDVTGELPIDLGDKPVFTIGRRDNNDLPLTGDRNVSTVHAVIFAVDGQWYLRDLHTRSGTRLNGSGIHQHQLDFNDEIQIGSFKMRFQPAATDSPASASGLDFSVEAATTTAEPLEMDLPPLAVDEDAAIPLEVDEPILPRADRPEVPLAPVIPVEDSAPTPTEEVEAADPFVEAELPIPEPDEVDMSPLEALEPLPDLEVDPSSPVETESIVAEEEPAVIEPLAEIPLELEEPVVEAEALSPVEEVESVAEPVAELPLEAEEPAPEPDDAEMSPLKALEALPDLEVDPSSPIEAEAVVFEEQPAAIEPLAEIPLELEEPVAKAEALSPVEAEPVAEPVAELPLEVEEPAAEPVAAVPVEHEENPFAAAEPLGEAPLEIEEPAIEPVAETADAHPTAAVEPEELDLSVLESLEPDLLSSATPDEVTAEVLPEEKPLAEAPLEVAEPAIEPVAETADVHPAAAAEPEELDLSALDSLEPELSPSAVSDENPFAAAEPLSETPLEVEEPAIEPVAEATDVHPAAAAEPEEFDLSALESFDPELLQSPATEEVPAAEIHSPKVEPQPAAEAPLELEDLDEAIASAPITPAAAGAAEPDELDRSLLESLEEFPVIESEPSPHATLDLEDLAAEPPAVPLPTYSDLSEEPVAAAPPVEIEPPSTIPADVADLIYTTDEPPPAPPVAEPVPAKPAKPKRKWWSRKKKERTPPPAPAPPAVEILDATEPTLESALEMSAATDTSTPDVSSESLSDTTFSRAVEEFAGASTGPIVEEPTRPAEKVETEPAPPPLTLDEITDGEEFVAVPEAEPEAPLEVAAVQPESHTEVFQPPSLTYSSTQDNQQTLADSTPVETAPPLDEPTVTDPALSEPPPVKAPSAPPPPFEPLPISTAAQAPLAPPPTSVTASRPSIFGFQFDGGSFLGGMPLRLKPLAPETNKTIAPPLVEAKPENRIEPPPAPRTPIIADEISFPEPIKPEPVSPPLAAPAEPAAAPLTFTNYAPSAEPVVMPIKQPPPAPPVASPPAVAAPIKTPPRPAPLPRPKRLADAMAVPPMAQSVPTTTPPRRNLTTAFDGLAPRSLAGGMVGGQPKTPPPPVRGFGVPGGRATARGADVFSQVAAPISVEVFGAVQGNASDFVIPEIRKPLMPSPPRNPPTPPPTSAFGNSSDNGNGDVEAPPTEEEFQEAGIPTEPLTEMVEPPLEEPPIALPADADPAPQPQHPPRVQTPKPRRSRVPVLLTLMILLLAGAWAGVYYFLSPASRVTGTLAFSNLAAQPMSDQLIFQQLQNARLHSEEVRSMARSMLVSANQDPGFLDDAVQFEQATTKTGKVEFIDNGEKLQLATRATDAGLGKARVDALLQSLKQKDADLVDLQARAQQADADAQAAVTQINTHLEDLQSQRTAAQARGENRPDPQEIASVTADSERLNKVWTLAKSDLADAQTALTDLQSLSTDKPPTADTDPQLTRLRRESGDLDQQISAIQLIADAGHSTLDQDNQLADLKTQSDDLAARVKQRQAQILADQALTPQQREVNRQKAIEALSVKLTDLQKAESDAKSAANASAVRLAELNTRLAQARQASTDDLITQISTARDDLKAKKEDAIEKDKQLAACVSLAGDPQVNVQALSDQRPIFAGGASVLILIIFSLMIVSASRSATAAIADRPAPHPQPHPADDADEPSPASL